MKHAKFVSFTLCGAQTVQKAVKLLPDFRCERYARTVDASLSGTSLKRFENLGGNFHRTFHTRRRHEAHHTVAVCEPIGERHVARDVLQPPADEALRAAHRI